MENEELYEFEMLEEAANMSFSSQLSLFNDLPKCLPSHQPVDNHVVSSEGAENLVSQLSALSPERSSRLTGAYYHPDPVNSNDDDEHDQSVDLDETLKCSPSLAKGVEFNDEEAWESFSHGSPQSRHRTESSGSDVTSPSGRGEVWKSPVKKKVLGRALAAGLTALHRTGCGRAECDVPRTDCLTAVEKSKVMEAPSAHPFTRVSEATEFADYHRRHTAHPHCHTSEPDGSHNSSSSSSSSGVESVHNSLPPPSALVSKLFPVLRRVEQPIAKARHVSEGQLPLIKSPSPISSTEGDSGIRSLSSTSVALSEDLKYKLTQLEEEIAKYRSENANLEKLRKEREEVSK